MERHIFIRDFRIEQGLSPAIIILKGSHLHIAGDEWHLYDHSGDDITEFCDISLVDLLDDMRIYLLALDADLFKTSYSSLPYRSWLNEKASDIDEQGQKRYEDGLDRSPETLIMYLIEAGVSSDTLTRLIFAPGNKYGEFLKSLQHNE